MIKNNQVILAEVKVLLNKGECTLKYDSKTEVYTLKKINISARATEGPLKGIWAYFASYEEAILYMNRKGTPFKVFTS